MRARRESASVPTVALAGYTNAGKSTLLNAITGADVGVGERLFHTLDPTTRSYRHDGRDYLVTDTVGFIRKLPHQLVEAFKATLEETRLADLMVHVVDGSQPDGPSAQGAIEAVDSVLEEIGADDQPRLLVYNKLDLLERPRSAASCWSASTTRDRRLRRHRRGRRRARDRIAVAFEDTLEEVELLVPYAEGGRMSELHASPATSSARTAPTASPSRRGSRARSSTASPSLRPTARPPARRLNGAPAGISLRAVDLPVRRLDDAATLPTRAHPGDAGLDLYASEAATSARASGASVGTGIAVEIPEGHAGLVLPALRPRRAARDHPGQRARADRLRLPGRAARAAAEHRSARRRSRSRRATGSPSC